ncbi:MAG TPA: Ig-like domain-containing protein [Longimicrobium sp.]|jgi:hypothetical protein
MKRITTAWRTTALVLFASVAAAACDNGTESRTPVAMAPNNPATLTSTAGAALSIPPAVRVFDDEGTGVEGVTVTFTVGSGNGSVTGATAVTNFDGVATVGSWKLGNAVGANTLVATAEGLNAVTFTATGIAGQAATIRVISGDAQTGTAGTALPAPFTVRVSDQFDNPVSGAVVTFAVTSGGGTVAPLTANTNAQGLATATLTLGRTSGANTVTATTPGAAPVTFTATARVGAAAAIAKTAGDNQTAQVNSAVTTAPVVTVTDAAGNGVPGVVVTFTVASGGGRVANTTATTGTTGTASSGTWTLGPTVGANTLTASAAGVTGTVTFTATATPPSVDPCTVNTPFTPRGTATGTLAAGDCLLASGQFQDFFSTTLAAASAEEFVVSSTAFDAFANLYDSQGRLVAFDDNSGGGTTASLRVFAPSGNYFIGASSVTAGATGAYSLTSRALTAPTGCLQAWIVPGITLNASLATTDCAFSDGSFVDSYAVYLRAGQQITIIQRSTAIDAFLILANAAGTSAVAQNDDDPAGGTTNSRLVYTATAAGMYQILATSFDPAEVGAYTLVVSTP